MNATLVSGECVNTAYIVAGHVIIKLVSARHNLLDGMLVHCSVIYSHEKKM